MSSEMPCSATAEELRTDAGTKPSGMPQAEMSLRDIAEAFVSDPDADVVGVVEMVLKTRKMEKDSHVAYAAHDMSDIIINHVEGQR